MKRADPYDRNWVEIKILAHLSDTSHPVLVEDLVDRFQEEHRGNASWAIHGTLHDDGLIHLRPIGGSNLVSITAQGKEILLGIYSGKTPCD